MRLAILIFLLTFCYMGTCSAQDFSGHVLYMTKMYNNDSQNGQSAKDTIQRVIDNNVDEWIHAENNFKLKLEFDSNHSYYANRYSPMALNLREKSNYLMAQLIYRVKNNYYYNSKTNELIEENLMMGEQHFIIKNQSKQAWKFTNVTKKIGNYVCIKAERNIEYRTRSGEQKVNKQVVWFAPDIAVPYGPGEFVGFPGLVLEVTQHNGTLEYKAKTIVLNAEKAIRIKRPPASRLIHEEQFNEEKQKYLENTKKMLRN